jgi:hypothetical protein
MGKAYDVLVDSSKMCDTKLQSQEKAKGFQFIVAEDAFIEIFISFSSTSI